MNFESFELANGLKVIVHSDRSTKVAVVNLLYNVGSRDEEPGKTGFAHLFEHLMFGGSKHIPSFDEPLQQVGGENNAFTSPDLTNYYISIPSNNLETAFWLESDRMLSLSFDPKVLEVQRKVVIEEFKQRYLNQPYGDAWLKIRPLAYQKHPYRWATIGEKIEHIEEATMEQVRHFFNKFYLPNNAILVVAGDVDVREVERLSKKWFEPIPSGPALIRSLPKESEQLESRSMETTADVPQNSIYKVYHMPGKLDNGYHTADLLSDVMGRGKSSRLYQRLIKETKLLSNFNTYITGSIDPGLLVIHGRLNDEASFEAVEAEISRAIENLQTSKVDQKELDKVKNQAKSSHLFSEVELLNRAFNLAFGTLLGDTSRVNTEIDRIQAVTQEHLLESAQQILRPENCSTLYYSKSGELA